MTYGSELYTSIEGTNWIDFSNVGPFMFGQLSDITYGDGQFVAVGPSGVIETSADGTNWTGRATEFQGNIANIEQGGGFFVAVGSATIGADPTPIVTSSDGIIWTGRAIANVTSLTGIAFGNNRFVATGANGVILYSGLISAMQPILSSISLNPSSLVQMIVKGREGVNYSVEFSSDLTHWTTITNFSMTAKTQLIIDQSPTNFSRGYYRASSL
jgi:hypothetical protein